MSSDTKYTYNSVPYNSQDQDKHSYNNYGGNKPSYQYKKTRLIHLNTAFATTNVSNGNTYYEFSWDLPQFQLYNNSKLRVVSYISNESSAKLIVVKIKDLLIDGNTTYNTDKEAFPTLFINHTGVASQMPNNQFCLTLLPQIINRITITLSNSLNARNAGFTISTNNGHFVISLLIEDDELIVDNSVSAYK